MKLKRVDKDEWMKCCRYCHHFRNGKCTNKKPYDTGDDVAVYKVSEEGHLSLTLEETLGSVDFPKAFREVEYVLRWNYKLSEKRVDEITTLLVSCWDKLKENLKEELDDKVSQCYQNNIINSFTDDGMTILDPENYCCKEWC